MKLFKSFIIALGFLLGSFGVAYGATILTTNSSDTLNTFRTNVNTSLTNLNTALGLVVTFPFPFTSQTWGVSTTTTIGLFNGFIANASSTINASLLINGDSTTTNATTTSFFATTASSTNLFGGALSTCTGNSQGLHWTGGLFSCATLSGFASSTLLGDNNWWSGSNIWTAASSTFTKGVTIGTSTTTSATSTNSFATTASSTNLFASIVTFDGQTFVLDNVNHRIGIGTSTPSSTLVLASPTTGNNPTLTLENNGAFAASEPTIDFKNVSGASTNFTHARISSAGGASFANSYIEFSVANPAKILTERARLTTNGLLGIGTTTPQWLLQLATSTGPQLTLSDSASITNNHWSFANEGGLFYLSTSSNSTYATSTKSALTVDANGFFTIPAIGGATACLHTDSTGKITPAASDCATGSTPGGSGTELQYRNGASFGAVTSSAFNSTLGILGLNTTTPKWLLQLASSSQPQLALSDSAAVTNNHWTLANEGGQFFLATSSPSTFATSSVSALSINANGIPTFPALGGSTGCAQFSSVGQLSNTGTACGGTGGITVVSTSTAAATMSTTTTNFTAPNYFIITISATSTTAAYSDLFAFFNASSSSAYYSAQGINVVGSPTGQNLTGTTRITVDVGTGVGTANTHPFTCTIQGQNASGVYRSGTMSCQQYSTALGTPGDVSTQANWFWATTTPITNVSFTTGSASAFFGYGTKITISSW